MKNLHVTKILWTASSAGYGTGVLSNINHSIPTSLLKKCRKKIHGINCDSQLQPHCNDSILLLLPANCLKFGAATGSCLPTHYALLPTSRDVPFPSHETT